MLRAFMALSAKGRAQSRTDVAQGATDVPNDIVPEITEGIHGDNKVPQLHEASFARSRCNEITNHFLYRIHKVMVIIERVLNVWEPISGGGFARKIK